MSGFTIEQHMTQEEAVQVFAELFALVEDYAPIWYDEEIHNRAEEALEVLRAVQPQT